VPLLLPVPTSCAWCNVLPFELSPNYLEKYTSLLPCCNRWNMQHGTGFILVLVLRELIHYSCRYTQKTIFTFPSPMTLSFDLLTPKLLCQTLLKRAIPPLSFNVVFHFRVSRWHGTDGWTDGKNVMHNNRQMFQT